MTEDPPIDQDTSLRINIVQINTEDIQGGAAIAGYRLYSGLSALGQNVRMLVKTKKSKNPDVIAVSSTDKEVELERELSFYVIHHECINANRTAISTTLFDYPIFGYNFAHSVFLKNADIINLHRTYFFCSLSSLKKIVGLKKPIVWTLHDQWLLTGGCHYTSGCNNYLKECMNCIQLENDGRCLPHFFLDKKRELIKEMNPVIVTPSYWLANIVKSVAVFKDLRVEVIPNSIDTALYTNIPKETARKSLNLPPDGFYFLFSLTNALEKRKGIPHLIAALQYCMGDPIFFNKVMSGEIKLMCFGYPHNWIKEMPIPLISLGKIESESELCTIYSAADVVLVPSLEDNLPNIVIEAMSCGTPAIAFHSGGIPEMIQNGVNGYLIEKGSGSQFAKAILDLIHNPERTEQMSKNCRTIALKKFSLEIQAKSYLGLYHELVSANGKNASTKGFSGSQMDREFLPDASDTDIHPDFPEIIKEAVGRYPVIKKFKFRCIKIIERHDSLHQSIDKISIFLKKVRT